MECQQGLPAALSLEGVGWGRGGSQAAWAFLALLNTYPRGFSSLGPSQEHSETTPLAAAGQWGVRASLAINSLWTLWGLGRVAKTSLLGLGAPGYVGFRATNRRDGGSNAVVAEGSLEALPGLGEVFGVQPL